MYFADAMLGRLAKWMRVLGYDTLYVHDIGSGDLLERAREEDRRILTRDTRLVRSLQPGEYLFIRDDDPSMQLRQVLDELELTVDRALFFSRCLECNSLVEDAEVDEVAGEVPDYVLTVNDNFTRCTGCGRVYWPGTHISKILERLAPSIDLKGGR
jgi:hypothetical protein